MEVKTIDVSGLEIAYRESEGSGPAAILIHGNSSSGQAFQHQLTADLGGVYRLVALDLPGHGASGRAEEPSQVYNMPGYAKAVAGLAKALDMEDAVLVGWSLGGHIALEAHDLLPQARGFFIFGTPPLAFPPDMENAFLPNPLVGVGLKADVTRAEAEAYASSFFRPEANVDLEPFVLDILNTDGRAREGLANSIAPDGYQDEVAIVAALDRPLAIVHGEYEQLVNLDYLRRLNVPSLWRGEPQIVEDAGHAPQWERPGIFNNLLGNFLDDLG